MKVIGSPWVTERKADRWHDAGLARYLMKAIGASCYCQVAFSLASEDDPTLVILRSSEMIA